MPSSRPGSWTQVYQMASRSPFGQSTMAGQWLWWEYSGPFEPGGMRM